MSQIDIDKLTKDDIAKITELQNCQKEAKHIYSLIQKVQTFPVNPSTNEKYPVDHSNIYSNSSYFTWDGHNYILHLSCKDYNNTHDIKIDEDSIYQLCVKSRIDKPHDHDAWTTWHMLRDYTIALDTWWTKTQYTNYDNDLHAIRKQYAYKRIIITLIIIVVFILSILAITFS